MDKTVLQTKWGLDWKRPKAMKYHENWAVEEEVANFLYGITRMIKPLSFLEIGTFEGVSAGAIGQALKDNDFGKLWTIDYKDYGQKEFIKTIGLEKYVKCVIGSSPETILEIYENNNKNGVNSIAINTFKFDMAFIDDGHSFEDAFRDLMVCHKVIRQFGYILGHDVINVPAVNNALNAFLLEHPNQYEKIILASYDGLFILKKL